MKSCDLLFFFEMNEILYVKDVKKGHDSQKPASK